MTEEYYNIEKILERRKVGNKFEYKIKWEGYPLNQSTWEPMKNLQNAHELIEEFDKTHPIDVESETPKKKENTNNNKKKKIEEEPIKEIKENDEELKNQKEVNSENNNDENSKILIFENENSYKVDSKLKRVLTVKNQNGKLMAIVEQAGEKGELFKTYIPTEELRKINPWILLQFYESKIKFT